MTGADIEAELILMTARLWKLLGLTDVVSLELNSLGEKESRQAYRAALISYLEQHVDQLDDDSKRRLHTNPLRVLDSKDPKVQAVLVNAPQLFDYLDEESRTHQQKLSRWFRIPTWQWEKLVSGASKFRSVGFVVTVGHLFRESASSQYRATSRGPF